MRRLTLCLFALFCAASALAAGARDVELGPVASFPYFDKVAFFIQGPMSARDLKVLKTQVLPQTRGLLVQDASVPDWLSFKAPRRVRGLALPKYWNPNDQLDAAALPAVLALSKRDPGPRTLPVLITNGVTLGTRKRRDLGFSLDAHTAKLVELISKETGIKIPRRGFVALANDDPHEERRLIDDPEVAAVTLAHEIGHALGLKHPRAKNNLM